jgi:pyruvate/2-oxoglutarate dehydrogenase complex dihydrolipoamide acyltransferase (E2) component
MMPRGFKPVGWVAAVGGAALSCYMLSLNVAAERAEVVKLEREILLAKQDIRTLQTELGTRGRLQQLEHWNAEVLALSAPTSAQFLDDAVTLARFEQRDKTIEEKAKVQMASMETAPKAAPQVQVAAPAVRKLAPVDYAAAAARVAAQPQPMIRQAAYVPSEAKPEVIRAAAVKSAAPAPAEHAKAKPAAPRAAAAKPAAPKDAKKVEVKIAEVKKARPKAESLRTMVAKLDDDDKPAQASGSAKSRSEAGLR